jgi:hypothetical protein
VIRRGPLTRDVKRHREEVRKQITGDIGKECRE